MNLLLARWFLLRIGLARFASHRLRCDLEELRWLVDCLKEVYALKKFSSFFMKLKNNNYWLSFATSKNNGLLVTLSIWRKMG